MPKGRHKQLPSFFSLFIQMLKGVKKKKFFWKVEKVFKNKINVQQTKKQRAQKCSSFRGKLIFLMHKLSTTTATQKNNDQIEKRRTDHFQKNIRFKFVVLVFVFYITVYIYTFLFGFFLFSFIFLI